MKIREMNKIINDKNSQDLNCNFKITGKSTSKLDLILRRLDKHETMFDLILKRLDEIDDFIVEQKEFNKTILSRIDNLVAKNNLKE